MGKLWILYFFAHYSFVTSIHLNYKEKNYKGVPNERSQTSSTFTHLSINSLGPFILLDNDSVNVSETKSINTTIKKYISSNQTKDKIKNFIKNQSTPIFLRPLYTKSSLTINNPDLSKKPITNSNDNFFKKDIKIKDQNKPSFKWSLLSSSINIIDPEDNDTQLAHSSILITKKRPRPSYRPIIIRKTTIASSSNSFSDNHNKVFIYNPSTTTESYPTPIKNNHRPLYHFNIFKRPWVNKFTPTLSPLSTTRSSTFDPLDDIPVLMVNNHRSSNNLQNLNKLTTLINYWQSFTTSPTKNNTNYEKDIWPNLTSSSDTSSSSSVNSIHSQTVLGSYPYFSSESSHPTTSSYDQNFFKQRPTNVVILSSGSSKPNNHINTRPSRPSNLQILSLKSSKIKLPENISSDPLMVLDPLKNDSKNSLPSTTIVHKNVIVQYKPGRPEPSSSSSSSSLSSSSSSLSPLSSSSSLSSSSITTQYPGYPIFTDSKNWPKRNETLSSDSRVTTLKPDKIIISTGSNENDGQETYEFKPISSINRPTIAIIGPPGSIFSTPSTTLSTTTEPTHQFFTFTPITTNSANYVTPINPVYQFIRPSSTVSSTPDPLSLSSTSIILTSSEEKPSQGYVHAIYAPPMPSKPSVAPITTTNNNSILALFGVDSLSGLFTRLTIFKTLLFTLLVMFLPPLTLAAAVSGIMGA